MDKQGRRDFILNGDMYKVIITLAIPIMINNLIQTLYNLADGVWVSKIGSVQFAATTFVWPVNFLFISIGAGLGIAGTSILSQLLGNEDIKSAKEYSSQIILITFICSIIFSILGFVLTPFIVKIMGATGELAKYSNIYLRITFLDIPFTFFIFNFNSIFNAQGNTVTPTILSGISAILNVILDPIFIFGLNLGIAGAAIATLLSKALLAVTAVYILKKNYGIIKPRFRGVKLNKEMAKKIFSVAIPSSVGQSGSALGFMVLNSFIASYGNATLAAFGMVNRITSLIMQPAMGVGAALTSIIGQNLGAQNFKRAEEGFKKSIVFTIIFSVIGALLLIWQDNLVINFFMQSKDDMEVINQGIRYLWFTCASLPLMGIFSVLQGVFQGSGHTKYSMYMEIGRLWMVRLPMILIFKYLTTVGQNGIWFSMSFSNLIICIYGYYIYKKDSWKEVVIR
ncbi:putative efflux protein, MATE family [Clostridium collagenovorans DSM 3089]|uniref:Probable multidrug resistance protein NorM n=1 Tax=Clostridium collagenovorans DSM 3089 TaxID=1121306 RepID=A0A1M5SLL1_9CLOT|nr:MATE family efflux transporter [Clostridium collagenovorans]SHH39451.1 putative efflux protein, MATE family [Clostridium collagenovorans DSM 3089]